MLHLGETKKAAFPSVLFSLALKGHCLWEIIVSVCVCGRGSKEWLSGFREWEIQQEACWDVCDPHEGRCVPLSAVQVGRLLIYTPLRSTNVETLNRNKGR